MSDHSSGVGRMIAVVLAAVFAAGVLAGVGAVLLFG